MVKAESVSYTHLDVYKRQTMPSANNNKLSLPIWTGTATQYATITPVAGMTYNTVSYTHLISCY